MMSPERQTYGYSRNWNYILRLTIFKQFLLQKRVKSHELLFETNNLWLCGFKALLEKKPAPVRAQVL